MRDRSGALPTKHSPGVATAPTTDFRIMRRTEIAPGWWGQPREVGDTPSATVADSFCREQNAATMNPNRANRIEYYAEPITTTAPIPPAAEQALARLERAFLPAAWSDDDNAPWLPKIPGPRKPAANPLPRQAVASA